VLHPVGLRARLPWEKAKNTDCIRRFFAALLACMTAKQRVLETVGQLPEDASFDEITRRLEVVAAIQKGLDSLERGEGRSIDEVEKLVASWTAK
jgi:predicted transcriptional regulator